MPIQLPEKIKTPEELVEARQVVADALIERTHELNRTYLDIDDPRTCLLMGLSVALQWCCNYIDPDREENTLGQLIRSRR